MDASKPLTAAEAAVIADEILTEVGEQMGELYAALPDLIWDHCEAYQRMDHAARVASVQAVAEVLGGSGYVYTYPIS
jgi:hypothetical protein